MKIKNKGFTLIEVLVTIAIIGILIAIIMSATVSKASACGWFSSCASTPSDTEKVASTQKALSNAVPLPTLSNSLERVNISKRLTTFDDPAKVSYIYLTSYGKVMAFYTIKGKVTSGSKRLTSTNRVIDDYGTLLNLNGGEGWNSGSTIINVDAPELDGTYGNSNPYIFFWTTDGTYVQWNGEYMLSDQPLKLTTQPELVREIK